MAVTSAQVVVSTTAVALNPTESDTVGGVVLFLRNTHGTDAVALGGSGVTAATGFRVPGATAGTTVGPIELPAGEQLYAIRTSTNDITVDVLRLGS